MSLREYTRSGRDNFEPVETELCFPCNACVYGVTPMPQQCNACCHNENAEPEPELRPCRYCGRTPLCADDVYVCPTCDAESCTECGGRCGCETEDERD